MNRKYISLLIVAAMLLAVFIARQADHGKEKASRKAPAPATAEDTRPLLAIVLDDFGYSKQNLAVLEEIRYPLTFAVLPDTPYAKSVCAFACENGYEVILHLPMEPVVHSRSMEAGTVMTDMQEDDIRALVAQGLGSVPGAVGASNHMGSKATADERVAGVVIEELGKRGLFFLDSMTIAGSVCGKVADERAVPCARRDIFIDNVLEKEAIVSQLGKAAEIARKKGCAVAIGHDRPLTVQVLKEVMPEMSERGIKFVKLSEIIRGRFSRP